MAHRPPPFAALRALEAACRHRSYSAAAAELDVTHSAISQAVRRLEEEVGGKLFHRRGATMEPTASSLALATAYAEAAGLVDRALHRVSDTSPNTLKLRAPAQLARTWLAPLLPDLAQRFPGLTLCLSGDDAGEADLDLAIQAQPPRPGFDGRELTDPGVRAYASPALLRRMCLDGPEAVLMAPLLIEKDGAAWTAWFSAAGLDWPGPLNGARFDDGAGLALEAALRGAGVALGDDLAARFAVARGELVPVCPEVVCAGQPLWAVWRLDHAKSALIEPFAAWLAAQALGEPVLVAPPRRTVMRLGGAAQERLIA